MAVQRSPEGDLLTDFVMHIFRLNGRFLEIAERLAEGSGLSAARWQVLGAILDKPLTVAEIARKRGLARQSVQRLADALVETRMCQYTDNPAHARAKLLCPTDQGRKAIEKVRPVQAAWANQVASRVGGHQLKQGLLTLEAIASAMEEGAPKRRDHDGAARRRKDRSHTVVLSEPGNSERMTFEDQTRALDSSTQVCSLP